MLKRESFRFTFLLLVLCGLDITYSANIYCYKDSITSITEFSLDNPEPLLNWTYYKDNGKTVFYVHGFGTNSSGPDIQAIVGAYLRVGEVNICILNWEKEAVSDQDHPYRIAVIKSRKVGKQFAQALIKLKNAGLPLSQLHVVGHSLGAQLIAVTGREVQKCGQIIPRITGLDPAGPLFTGPNSQKSLRASDAIFVDNIHTNPGSLGNNQSDANVDVWANCGSSIQPECVATALQTIDLCSHIRSWKYFAESIENPTAFQVRSADSCDKWKCGNEDSKTIYWGINTDTTACGNFYMKTNGSSPYGMGVDGSQP